jgi:lysosomal acid lipase/cholesteryl ester hydrolase
MYDYGVKNMEKYNQTTAPLYNITNMPIPVALYWADKDWLADPKDVDYIRKRVPNIVDDFECLDWNHLDFLWAENTNTLLYGRLVKLLRSF